MNDAIVIIKILIVGLWIVAAYAIGFTHGMKQSEKIDKMFKNKNHE